MSDLSAAQRERLELITEGDDLSCLTVRQAFAYGVALGLYLSHPTPLRTELGTLEDQRLEVQNDHRGYVDDCSIEVQEAMGWEVDA